MTKQRIPPEHVHHLLDFLRNTIGLHTQEKDISSLEKRLLPIIEDFSFSSLEDWVKWILAKEITREDILTLARHLTIGETYFFRDSEAFKYLREHIFPDLIKRKALTNQSIRIWSCASCSGEEAYSIAILLRELIPDIEKWNISILATDINAVFLQAAKKGLYRRWSLRSMPDDIEKRYFLKLKEDLFQLKETICNMVTFRYLNLVEDNYPSLINGTNAMDLILCNNILIYFSEETNRKVIDKLSQALVQDGLLIVSGVEAPFIQHPQLHPLPNKNVAFFQKTFLKQPSLTIAAPRSDFKKPRALLPPKTKEKSPLERAETAFATGQYNLVIEILKDKENPEYFPLLAKSYANMGDFNQALFFCEELLKKEKTNPMFYLMHATILQEKGEVEEAIASLKKALYLDTHLTIAHFFLGCLEQGRGHYEHATRHFRNTRDLLAQMDDEIVPYSDGISVNKLKEIIESMEGVRK